MSTELRDLLELASEDVTEVDLADRAWQAAAAERRVVRRRVLLGAGGLAAAGALATVLGRGDERAAAPATTSDDAAEALDERLVGALRVCAGPRPADEASLPPYPDSEVLALPGLLGTGAERPRPVLSPDGIAGTNASVRAVLLVRAVQGGFQPVLYTPLAEPQHLHVPGMLLVPVRTGTGGDTDPVLGPRTIDDDRHRVVVAQPRKVVVLDARDASVTDIAVPDETLVSAGWTHDGRTVVAAGRDDAWLVDTVTRTVRRSTEPAAPGWGSFAREEDLLVLRSFSSEGALTGSRPVPTTPAVPYGEPVANLELWTASGADLEPALTTILDRSQGVLAAQDDLSISPRLLAAPDDPSVPGRAYRPLAWGPRDTLVLESRSVVGPGEERWRLLAWDVIGARLWRVGDVEAAEDQPSGFTGIYAL